MILPITDLHETHGESSSQRQEAEWRMSGPERRMGSQGLVGTELQLRKMRMFWRQVVGGDGC
jgi:hypothetical protein